MNPRLLFALMAGLALGISFLNIPPGLSTLMGLYGLNYTGISVLISALLWSHALLQVPAGIVTDRLGIGRTLVLAAAFMSLGNLGPAANAHFAFAVACRVIVGIGTSFCFVAVMKMVAVYAPPRRAGTYQSFFAGFFSIGTILAYLVIPRLLAFGWRWIYLTPGILSLLLLIASLGLRIPHQSMPSSSKAPLGRIFRIRAGWVLGFYHAISWGATISLGNWIPSLLAEFLPGSTTVQLAWGGIFVMFVSGLSRISGGFVLLRWSSLLVANGSILILTLLFLGLFTVHVPALLLLFAILAAWFSNINFGAIFHLASTCETESLATLFGFINFLANIGAILFTFAFGLSKDMTGSLSWGFGLMAILAFAALVAGRGVIRRDHSPGAPVLATDR